MRDLFPAVYSTLAPQALIELILSSYDLGQVEKCLLWNRGLSDVYLIESADKSYILRISHHHWRSRLDIDFELELLNFLHQRHLPVAYPISTKDNALYVTIPALEGDRYAALFPYAEGSVPLGDLNLEQSKIFGRTLAKLHDTGLDFAYHAPPKALTLEYLLDESLLAIAPFLDKYSQDLEYLQNRISAIKHQLQDLPQEYPYWSVCWGDPHSGNAHFTADNQITIFDFDQCGYGWRTFDVAKFLQVSMNAGMCKNIRNAFFEGYQEVKSLTDLEFSCIQALTQTAHIWSWAINIKGASVHCWSKFNRHYFQKRLEHLKCLDSSSWTIF